MEYKTREDGTAGVLSSLILRHILLKRNEEDGIALASLFTAVPSKSLYPLYNAVSSMGHRPSQFPSLEYH